MNYKRLNELKKLSPLTYAVERIFWFAQFVFVGPYFFKTRVWVTEQPDPVKCTGIRSVQVELYLVCWALILGFVAVLLWASPSMRFLACIPAYRVLELVQSAINMNIFDRLRITEKKHYVASKERTLLISIWNFIEVWLCFGMLYSAYLSDLTNAQHISDAYYFSAITQLTIGYGDLSPSGILRLFAPLQGFVAFLLAVIVLSRFVSLLPAMDDRSNEG